MLIFLLSSERKEKTLTKQLTREPKVLYIERIGNQDLPDPWR
jgi:hypothetical protein